MGTDVSIVEGPYLRDILDQPRALRATLDGLEISNELRAAASRLQKGDFRCVALTGMGSSFHALHPSNLELIEKGFVSTMVETSELVHHQSRLFDPKTLIIAVSQSGQSVEMVRLLEKNAGRATILAVTNTAKSALAANANAAILTAAGEEFSVSCKTYTTALMGLKWLTTGLCGGDFQALRSELSGASQTAGAYLEGWADHVESISRRLSGIHRLFLVGRGRSLAAVGTGALTIKESDHFSAEGMSSAAFRHGPFEMLGGETFVIVYEGENPTSELNLRMLRDIRDEGGRAELVGEESDFVSLKLPVVPQSVRPIVEALPGQMMTLALAAQVGREPGRFERATKVTTIE